jgi:predicted porin
MKKTLIAIAALAATGAFAQSTVTIDGVVDAGYVSYDMKGAKVGGVDRNLTTTSQFNFRVASDLGGGLKATWRSETDFVVTSNGANQGTVSNTTTAAGGIGAGATGLTNGTAATFMNGEQELALAGGFGRVGFGAINNTALTAHGYSQPFGTAIGSGFNATSGSAVTANVRNDNTLQYTSPAFAGGFKVNFINRKAQNGSASSNNANYNASLGAQQQASVNSLAALYNAGPINFVATRDVQDATGVNSTTTGTGAAAVGNRNTFTALAGNYNFGAATIYAGWQANRAVSTTSAVITDRTTTTLAAQYVMGVNTFMGSVQRANNSLAATTSSLLGLGYEYALSKTAALTARYERIADQAGFATTTGYNTVAGNNDRTRMGVGLRVGF